MASRTAQREPARERQEDEQQPHEQSLDESRKRRILRRTADVATDAADAAIEILQIPAPCQRPQRREVDGARIGAAGFCLGGSIVLTWACTDNRLAAIAPFYGAAPRPRGAIRRMCQVVRSWPGKDFTTKAARVLETELTAAGIVTIVGPAATPGR